MHCTNNLNTLFSLEFIQPYNQIRFLLLQQKLHYLFFLVFNQFNLLIVAPWIFSFITQKLFHVCKPKTAEETVAVATYLPHAFIFALQILIKWNEKDDLLTDLSNFFVISIIHSINKAITFKVFPKYVFKHYKV